MFSTLAITLHLALCSAAFAQDAPSLDAPSQSADAGDPNATYQVGARDALSVDVYGEDDLTGSFVVADDGTIDFPLLGRVNVNGRTAYDVDSQLTELLAAKYLVNPQVHVRVASFGSRPVQVLGAVAKPGTYYLSGPTTVLDILTLAGGIKEEASVEVRLQRKNRPSEPETINLERLVGYSEGNAWLSPGDVVYVPPGPLVYVSGQVDDPGPVAYRDGLTVTQAINKAGGPTKAANLKSVLLLSDGKQSRVNYKKIQKGGLPDPKLKPDDQITVKESVF